MLSYTLIPSSQMQRMSNFKNLSLCNASTQKTQHKGGTLSILDMAETLPARTNAVFWDSLMKVEGRTRPLP